jgi:hypothetical protein
VFKLASQIYTLNTCVWPQIIFRTFEVTSIHMCIYIYMCRSCQLVQMSVAPQMSSLSFEVLDSATCSDAPRNAPPPAHEQQAATTAPSAMAASILGEGKPTPPDWPPYCCAILVKTDGLTGAQTLLMEERPNDAAVVAVRVLSVCCRLCALT